MTELQRPLALLATGVLVLAACGGGGAATAPSDDVAATSGPAVEATEAGAGLGSEAPATVAPAATEPASAGGMAGGVCDLVTADELAEIFGVSSVATTVFEGPPDTCSADSDAGDPLVAWTYSTAQAQAVYDAMAADSQSVDVPGIGDKAAFVQNTGLLVLRGNVLVVIGVVAGADDAEREEFAKQIGTIAAGRF